MVQVPAPGTVGTTYSSTAVTAAGCPVAGSTRTYRSLPDRQFKTREMVDEEEEEGGGEGGRGGRVEDT